MKPSTDDLLNLLGVCRSDPPLEWHVKDACFLHLDLLRYIEEHGNRELLDWFLPVYREHNRECGGCTRNVRATSAEATHPVIRELYGSLTVLGLQALSRVFGHRFDVEETDSGAWVRLGPPPGLEESLDGVDVFAPRDTRKQGVHILRAATRQVFDNPSIVLQALDESACQEIQGSQERPSWGVLQWGMLVPDVRTTLILYWRGQSNVICEDMSFASRYRGLVAAYSRDQETTPGDNGVVTLALRDLALRYDGRSRFAGYAKKTLKYRKIDRARHGGVDGLGHAETGHGKLEDGREEDTVEDPEERPAPSQRVAESVELRDRIEKLSARLSDRENQILTLVRQNPDIKDCEIADRLEVRRETINRDRAKIAEKARKLDP